MINTTVHAEEEEIINQCMRNNKKLIIIYGKNCCDENIRTKYKQLVTFGFKNVKIYWGYLNGYVYKTFIVKTNLKQLAMK